MARLLVVEDERKVLLSLQRGLERVTRSSRPRREKTGSGKPPVRGSIA
jgi:hypothetical protein